VFLGRPRGAALVLPVVGCATALVPLAAYTWTHFGTFTTPHLAGNPAIWEGGLIARSTAAISAWFLSFDTSSLWRTAPLTVLALTPLVTNSRRGGTSFLFASALVYTVLVIATAPNVGGGQWGPRYLLFAFIPISVLIADALQWLARFRVGLAAAVLLIGVGAWTGRTAYRDLRETKRTYARILEFVRQEVEPGTVAVTDLWWLDQVAAAATDTRTILYVADGSVGSLAVNELNVRLLPRVTLLTSRDESPADIGRWAVGTCYVESGRAEIEERALQAIRLERHCPY
jgi:hypothetical protein